MGKYFKELDVAGWSGRTVILDIDGTITEDGSSELDPLVSGKIKEIALSNYVFLFSNKHLALRDSKVAQELNITLIKSPFKKPNKKVIDELPEELKRNMVVIGDKVLIDGFFAKNIGAELIKVGRLTSKDDDLKTKLTYLLDNFALYFIK